MNQTPHQFDTSTRLAFSRTWLAYERTMMAWVRTGTSMITFGFSVYKFFQLERDATRTQGRLIGSAAFAEGLVGLGLLCLLLAAIEHRRDMKMLQREGFDPPPSLATRVAAMVSVLGLAAMVIVALRQ